MSFEAFNRSYKQRISYSEVYTPVYGSFGLGYLGHDSQETYGVPDPKNISRIVLLFGYFRGDDTLQCQPWAPVSVGAETPLHGHVHKELNNNRKKFGELTFDGSEGSLTDHFWNMYIGRVSLPASSVRYVAYVGLAMHQDVLSDEKNQAVARLTEPGGVLEDHVVCGRFEALGGRTVRIEGGQAYDLTSDLVS